MGRRKGAVNKVEVLPRGVTLVDDGRHDKKPFCVRHRSLPREFFATAELAVSRKLELVDLEKSQGSAALEYDRAVHADVTAARAIVPDVPLAELARFYLVHHAQGEKVLTGEAIRQFVAAKRARSVKPEGKMTPHVWDLQWRLRLFALAFEDRPINEIEGGMVLQWLTELDQSARSIKNFNSALSNFFNFSLRRKWLVTSPMADIAKEDLPEVRSSGKHSLSVDQALAVIAVVREISPRHVLHFGLRFMLGFRTAEAERFRWEWIQPELGRVVIPGWFYSGEDLKRGSKTGDDWAIEDVPAAFWAIYKTALACEQQATPSGQVPAPWWKLWCDTIRPAILTDLGLTSWPHNACRDTFCTLHMSAYRSAERTALVLKHRNSQTLWQSYLGTLVPQAEALEFFEALPPID